MSIPSASICAWSFIAILSINAFYSTRLVWQYEDPSRMSVGFGADIKGRGRGMIAQSHDTCDTTVCQTNNAWRDTSACGCGDHSRSMARR
jgi:hypothetical protein